MVRRFLPAVAAGGFIATVGYQIPAMVPDSEHYIAIALGNRESVQAPFSQRLVLPTIAGALHDLGLSLPAAFVVLGVVALAGFCVAVRVLLRELPGVAVFGVIALPVIVSSYRSAYLPDLGFAALLAGFFVLLRARPAWWVPPLLVLLVPVRESVLLVCVVLLVVAWRHRERALAYGAAGALVAGYGVNSLTAAGGAPSLHNVSGPLYLLAKLPYNGMKNLTGFEFATNDLSHCGTVPQYKLPFAFGNISSVGLCPFNVGHPAWTLSTWLAVFGLAPAILFALLRQLRNGGQRPVWLQVALWSGLLGFLAAPFLGASVDRLAAYGWPAMIVVMPLLLFAQLPRDALTLIAASFVLAWMPAVLGLFLGPVTTAIVTVIIALPAQMFAYRWTRGRLIESAPEPVKQALAA